MFHLCHHGFTEMCCICWHCSACFCSSFCYINLPTVLFFGFFLVINCLLSINIASIVSSMPKLFISFCVHSIFIMLREFYDVLFMIAGYWSEWYWYALHSMYANISMFPLHSEVSEASDHGSKIPILFQSLQPPERNVPSWLQRSSHTGMWALSSSCSRLVFDHRSEMSEQSEAFWWHSRSFNRSVTAIIMFHFWPLYFLRCVQFV